MTNPCFFVMYQTLTVNYPNVSIPHDDFLHDKPHRHNRQQPDVLKAVAQVGVSVCLAGCVERLFDRHAELVAGAADLIGGCGCESGCPACTGPRLERDVDAKALALRLLRALVAGMARTERPGAAA